MSLHFVFFSLLALASQGEAKTLEEVEEQLNFLKENMEEKDIYFKKRMEASDQMMKEKIEALESNEISMGRQIVEMKKKIDTLEWKLESKIDNSNYAEDQSTKKRAQESILHKTVNTKETMFKNSASKFEYKLGNKGGNNTEERLAYLEEHVQDMETSIEGMKKDITDVGGQVSILEDSMEDVLKRSDFCSYQVGWNTDDSTITSFDELILDNNNIPGASMDIDKGEFTAGVSGIYNIAVSMRFRGGDNNAVYLQVNGAKVAESRMISSPATYSDNAWDMGGRQMMMQLTVGDKVSMYAAGIYYLNTITFCINLAK